MSKSDPLVEPAFHTAPNYTRTLGPEVSDLARLANFGPDPEQELALNDLFAFDVNGKSSAFELAVIACRQNLKTGLFKQAALGWLFLTDQRLTVWSAHEFRTSQEAFRDMTELIEGCPELDRRVKNIYRGNGDEAIEIMGGQRLIFKARTKGGGRGLSGDKVILDEAFALQGVHMGALLPTLSARPDPQVVYGSSAGLADSAVLRGVRDRGRSGSSSRLAYMEWSVERGGCHARDCSHTVDMVGCVLDDESRWYLANPALGRRIDIETVRAERQALPPVEFARERLGWWDEAGVIEPAFGPGQWEACQVPDDMEPSDDVTIGFAVSIDQAFASIAAAAPRPDGRVHLGVVDRRRGTSWAIPVLLDIQQRRTCPILIDGRGPAAGMIPALEAAGVEVMVLSTAEVLNAHASLFDKVQDRQVTHFGYADLDDAVAGAQKRTVGDRWAWGRKTSAFDVSMLEAATLAASTLSDDYDVVDSIF